MTVVVAPCNQTFRSAAIRVSHDISNFVHGRKSNIFHFCQNDSDTSKSSLSEMSGFDESEQLNTESVELSVIKGIIL